MRPKHLLPFLLFALASTCARADVGVVLNESLDTSIARITGSGHSAIYFSRICSDSPVKLRLCRPGESGSIMSNYTTLGEDQPFEWNIAPLDVYLYGGSNAQDRPLFASDKIKKALEERYREQYLRELCPGPPCSISNKAEWREMVAATASRSIYIFAVKTSVAQDEQLIEQFNAMPNVNHFNGFTRNCATFARKVINTYFPHAARPDYINDFGMTSPKAISHSFARYARHHPADEYRVLHFAQVPGTIKRSTVARDGTEQLFRSKKLLVPMLLLASHELPAFAASYLITGRFDPQHEFEQHPSALASGIDYEMKLAKQDDDGALFDGLKQAKTEQQEDIVGAPRDWRRYREEFDSLLDEAVHEEIITDRNSLDRVFKQLSEQGQPVIDAKNSLWLELPDQGPYQDRDTRVGLTVANINAPGSDPRLAYEILLAHVQGEFSSPSHRREPISQFKEDWALLQTARARLPISFAQR